SRSNPALAIVLLAGCETTWIDPMEDQKKFNAYKENEFFSDGRAMRPLVPGTISREQVIGDPALREGVVGNQPVDTIPIKITPELLATGKKRFEITCGACHGLLGDGESVVASKMALKPPPSLL